MKKIKINKNLVALKKMDSDIVRPLLSLFETAKIECKSIEICSAFSALSGQQQSSLITAFSQTFGVKAKKQTFLQACNTLVQTLNLSEIKRLVATYSLQSNRLFAGDYELTVESFDKTVHVVFCDALYTSLFDGKDVWTSLGHSQLTREVFHDNFRSDNDYPSSCPYCDLDTITSEGSLKLDHFLPKKKFPLLAVHPMNLISACESCNSGGFGKGQKVEKKIVSPYFVAVEDRVMFSFDRMRKELSVQARPNDLQVAGFLALMKLPKRYGKENVAVQYRHRMDAFISTMSGKPMADQSEIEKYFNISQAGAPLTVALRYWLKNSYIPAKLSGI